MMTMVLLPDERLFCQSQPVQAITDQTRDLVAQMFAVMRQSRGIGLAGVQVGYLERLFITDVETDRPRVFINPTILERSEQPAIREEGCLSIPGVFAEIQRPAAIRVAGLNEQGEPFELEAEGLLARVIQHEYDHLEGTLFYQHLPKRRQSRFLKAYQQLMPETAV